MNSSSHERSAPTPNVTTDVDEVVDGILQIVPRVARRIRLEMRAAGTGALTVPQLRALLYVRRHPGTGLSPLAEHVGLSLPSASGLVERLVRADLVERINDPDERRRIQLRLTPTGVEHVGRAHLLVRSRLSADLAELSTGELGRLATALDILARLGQDDAERRP